MKPPSQIKVGPHTYAVVRKAAPEMRFEDEDFLGWHEPSTLEIWLVKGLKQTMCREILLHEILHACGYPSLMHKTLEEEAFVDGIAPVLLEVLRDNPELVTYLTCPTNQKPKNAGRTPPPERKPSAEKKP